MANKNESSAYNKDLAFGAVLITRDHPQNLSLTCSKDKASNCYSLFLV